MQAVRKALRKNLILSVILTIMLPLGGANRAPAKRSFSAECPYCGAKFAYTADDPRCPYCGSPVQK